MKFLKTVALLSSSYFFRFATAAGEPVPTLTAQKDANGCINSVTVQFNGEGQSLTYNPPDDLQCGKEAVVLDPMSVDEPGRYSYFYGTSGDKIMNLVIDNNNDMKSGTVHNVVDGDEDEITIIPVPGGTQVAARDRPESFIPTPPEEGGQADDALSNHNHTRTRKLQQQEAFSTIDIMVVWTILAECELVKESDETTVCDDTISDADLNTNVLDGNSREAMNLHVRLTVFQTNIALMNSGVDARLNLVHAQRDTSNYREYETGEGENRKDGIANGLYDITCPISGDTVDGCESDKDHFAWVSKTREETGADMVALLAQEGGGRAWRNVSPSKEKMFSSTEWKFAAQEFVLAHELGHNFGCRHDRGQVGACGEEDGFNFGWKAPGNVLKTIMSYNCQRDQDFETITGNNCPGVNPEFTCPLVQHFSSSSDTAKTRNGRATGNASNDCARQINNVRTQIAGFFDRPGTPTTPAPVASPSAPVASTPAPVASTPAPVASTPLTVTCGFDKVTLESDGTESAIPRFPLGTIDDPLIIDYRAEDGNELVDTNFWYQITNNPPNNDNIINVDISVTSNEFEVGAFDMLASVEHTRAAGQVSRAKVYLSPFTCNDESGDEPAICEAENGRATRVYGIEVTATDVEEASATCYVVVVPGDDYRAQESEGGKTKKKAKSKKKNSPKNGAGKGKGKKKKSPTPAAPSTIDLRNELVLSFVNRFVIGSLSLEWDTTLDTDRAMTPIASSPTTTPGGKRNGKRRLLRQRNLEDVGGDGDQLVVG